MGRKLALAFSVLLVAAGGAPAWAAECPTPDTSALHAVCLAMQVRDQAERTLDGLETRLRKLVSLSRTADLSPDDGLMTALTAQETAWRHYVRDECTLAGASTRTNASTNSCLSPVP